MDRLWTPWRYQFISGEQPRRRAGVPEALDSWPGEDTGCVFCNLIRSVEWAAETLGTEAAERAGLVVTRLKTGFVSLNAYPYASGHLLVVPYRHSGSLAELPASDAHELIETAQRIQTTLQTVYKPDGINLGMNLGAAAGAGVADHLHLHLVPRWFGDINFMTVTAETRILPETLETTWIRVRKALSDATQSAISTSE